MNSKPQTMQQIDRALDKIFNKFPKCEDSMAFTDIHLRANPDNGDFLAFDDDDNELNRCVVDEWIENSDEAFYQKVAQLLRKKLKDNHERIDSLGISKPFSFVLEDEEKEPISELYLADDETIIIGGDLMENLDNDLDTFFDGLMKE